MDLRAQAKSLDGVWPDAFMPTMKISFENFTLKKQVKALEEKLEKAQRDVDFIKAHDEERLSTGMERLTWEELVLMNRKLSDDIQELLKHPQPYGDHELYKTAAYVFASEYAKCGTPMPAYFKESKDL